MRMISRATALLTVGLACMMLSAAANAVPITLQSQGWSNGFETGSIYGIRNVTVRAGEFRFEVEGGGTLDAFCINVLHNLVTPGTYDMVEAAPGALSAAQLTRLGKLYDHHYASINSSATSAAFQLAVWEIIYDSTLNLTSGAFSSAGFNGARTIAQGWLSALDGRVSLGLYELFVLNPVDPAVNQTLITARPSAVPEPGTLALLGAGLLAAGALRRRRLH